MHPRNPIPLGLECLGAACGRVDRDVSISFSRNPVLRSMTRSHEATPCRRNDAADSDDNEAGPSRIRCRSPGAQDTFSDLGDSDNGGEDGPLGDSISSDAEEEGEELEDKPDGLGDGMDLEGFSGPKEMVVKPLTPEALAAFRAAKERTGVIYISRIPPGMRPTKVRHLMNQYGEVGKVYLQQEGECVEILALLSPD